MKLPGKIKLSESGLRDGLQKEKVILTADQKLEIIQDLLDAGCRDIDVGSFVRPDKVPQMAATPEVFQRLPAREDVIFRALVPNMKGLERALEVGVRQISVGISASTAHNLANFNRTPEESILAYGGIIARARDNGVTVRSSIQMAFGSPWEGVISLDQVRRLAEVYVSNGISHVTLADTAGVAVPDQVYNYFSKLKEEYPDVEWDLHLHNTRGVAMSNMFAAMLAGVICFSTSVAGLGGCPFIPEAAGNLATEDVVHVLDEMHIETGLDIDKIIAVSRKMERLLGHEGRSYILRAGKTCDLIERMKR